MLSPMKSCLAEPDDASSLESHPAEQESGDAIMDFDVKAESVKSKAEMDRLLAEPAAQETQQGVEAYVRDLPSLLAGHHANKVVAYRGTKRLAIAGTRELLLERLKEDGVTEETTGIYIKKIRPNDDPERGR